MDTTPKLDGLAIVVLHHLQSRRGKLAGISAAALSVLTGIHERAQRSAISLLRDAGHAVVGTPETGYYMAQNADELRECCAFLRSRAMHSLTIEARLMRLTMPQLLGQISIEMYAPAT